MNNFDSLFQNWPFTFLNIHGWRQLEFYSTVVKIGFSGSQSVVSGLPLVVRKEPLNELLNCMMLQLLHLFWSSTLFKNETFQFSVQYYRSMEMPIWSQYSWLASTFERIYIYPVQKNVLHIGSSTLFFWVTILCTNHLNWIIKYTCYYILITVLMFKLCIMWHPFFFNPY